MIFWVNICDHFFDSIRPKGRFFKVDNGPAVTIICRPLQTGPSAPTIQDLHERKADGRQSQNIKAAEKQIIPPHSHTWLNVSTRRHRLIISDHKDNFYNNHGLTSLNGMEQVEPMVPFCFIITCFMHVPHLVVRNKNIAQAISHPSHALPVHVATEVVFGIIRHNTDTTG